MDEKGEGGRETKEIEKYKRREKAEIFERGNYVFVSAHTQQAECGCARKSNSSCWGWQELNGMECKQEWWGCSVGTCVLFSVISAVVAVPDQLGRLTLAKNILCAFGFIYIRAGI